MTRVRIRGKEEFFWATSVWHLNFLVSGSLSGWFLLFCKDLLADCDYLRKARSSCEHSQNFRDKTPGYRFFRHTIQKNCLSTEMNYVEVAPGGSSAVILDMLVINKLIPESLISFLGVHLEDIITI